MKLVVDIGNSRIKWLVQRDGRAGAKLSAAQYRQTGLRTVLNRFWGDLPMPEAVWVGCVAGKDVQIALREWLAQHWELEPRFVATAAAGHGVRNGYEIPTQLGVDRWAALVAARHLLPDTPCVVTDCGTALTLDVLAASGKHLGGLILPGIGRMYQSLVENAAALQDIDIRPAGGAGHAVYPVSRHSPDARGIMLKNLGRNTRQGVERGTVYAIDALLEKLVRELSKPTQVKCILTGGEADFLAPLLKKTYRVVTVPDLVLRGIALLAEDGDF